MAQRGGSQADSATLFGRRTWGKLGGGFFSRHPFCSPASCCICGGEQGATSARRLQPQHPFTPRSLSEQVLVLPKASPWEQHPLPLPAAPTATPAPTALDRGGLAPPAAPRASLKLQLGCVCSEESRNPSSNVFYVVETK